MTEISIPDDPIKSKKDTNYSNQEKLAKILLELEKTWHEPKVRMKKSGTDLNIDG